MKIGFDLDNTLIDYSDAVKVYSGTLDGCNSSTISELRTYFGEKKQNEEWTKAQSWIYSEGLNYAKLTTGVFEILEELVSRKCEFRIFSHKTQFGPARFGSKQFRSEMDKWLSNSKIQKLCNNKVLYFETLDEKVEAISYESFTHFVDDLLKVLKHKHFPDSTVPILFFPELEKSTDHPNSTIFTISNFASLLDILPNSP